MEFVIAKAGRPLVTVMALHADPFDRLLVAQARTEGLLLLTSDAQVTQYGASVQAVRRSSL